MSFPGYTRQNGLSGGYYAHTIASNSRPSSVPFPRTGTRSQRPFKLWVLSIAINEYGYSAYPNLRGCIADADDLEKYLMADLGVPNSMIKRLRNRFATRDAILQEFDNLARDPRILKDDPILIYYAGHGGETSLPPKEGGGDIQFMIPTDCETYDRKGVKIHGIADFVLGEKLKRIAETKGNNITVIFDCCHSGSGVRDPEGKLMFRSVTYRAGIPPEFVEMKSSFSRTRNALSTSIHQYGGTASSRIGGFGKVPTSQYANELVWHSVLLAACSSKEDAREISGRGLFTKELLKTMRSLGSNITKVTYKELFTKIPSFNCDQNPQCEGDHGNRFVFGKDVKAVPAPQKPVLGQSSARLPDLVFYIPNESTMEMAHKAFRFLMTDKSANAMANFRLETNPRDNHCFALSFDQDRQYFEIFNNKTQRKLSSNLMRGASEEDFKSVFQGIASYSFYLQYSSQVSRNHVSLGVFKATGGRPYGQNLIQEGGMRINITEDGSNLLFELQNMTSRDFYPVLFCFNEIDYSIYNVYQPPLIAGMQRVDPPLRANSTLSIGHEHTDAQRLISHVRDGHDREVGYLKLFLSTEYIDLSGIEQEPPMNPKCHYRGMKQKMPLKPLRNDLLGTTVQFTVWSRRNNIQQRIPQAPAPSRETRITRPMHPSRNSSIEDLSRRVAEMYPSKTGTSPHAYYTTRGSASTREDVICDIDKELLTLEDNINRSTAKEQKWYRDLDSIRREVETLTQTSYNLIM